LSDEPNRSAARVAYERIRLEIVTGRLSPGARLPAAELAARLEISRSPVREALIMLEADGYVIGEHNRGYSVRPLNRDILLQLYEVRAELEAFGVRKAAEHLERLSASDRRQVLRAMDELDELRDEHDPDVDLEAIERMDLKERRPIYPLEIRQRMIRANRCFHDTLISASGNPQLMQLITRTIDRGVLDRAYDFVVPDLVRRINDFHRMIFERVLRGDGRRAGLLMAEHIYINRDLVMDLIDAHGGDISAIFLPGGERSDG